MVALGLVPGDADAGAKRDPALFERADDDVGDVFVAPGEDLGKGLEEGDVHAEVGEHRGELAPDRPGTDHRRRTGQVAPVQELVGGLHIAPVHLEAVEHPGHGTGSEHDVGSLESAERAVGGRDLDDLAREQPPGPGHDCDLALLQQTREPLEELVDDLVLAVLARRELDDGLARLYAELLRPPTVRNTDAVSRNSLAGTQPLCKQVPADLVLFDHGYGQTGGCAVEGGRVPARAAADDDDVVLRRLSLARWQTDHLLVS